MIWKFLHGPGALTHAELASTLRAVDLCNVDRRIRLEDIVSQELCQLLPSDDIWLFQQFQNMKIIRIYLHFMNKSLASFQASKSLFQIYSLPILILHDHLLIHLERRAPPDKGSADRPFEPVFNNRIWYVHSSLYLYVLRVILTQRPSPANDGDMLDFRG